jgi:hypothetical protein
MLLRYLAIALILAIVAGAIVVPFAVGFVRGAGAQTRQRADARSPQVLGPLARVATIYGRFFSLYLIIQLAQLAIYGKKFLRACANTPYPAFGAAGSGVAAKPGASLTSDGTVQVCATHPTAYEWFLYALIRLPSLVLWGMLLLLVWQLIRQAARGGPFSRQSAGIMYGLGAVILAGTAIEAAVGALGADLMARVLLVHPPYVGGGIAMDVLFGPLKALVPWPALAGAALLSFARMTRVGAELDEEVKATV